jgi:hypothetical protein
MAYTGARNAAMTRDLGGKRIVSQRPSHSTRRGAQRIRHRGIGGDLALGDLLEKGVHLLLESSNLLRHCDLKIPVMKKRLKMNATEEEKGGLLCCGREHDDSTR